MLLPMPAPMHSTINNLPNKNMSNLPIEDMSNLPIEDMRNLSTKDICNLLTEDLPLEDMNKCPLLPFAKNIWAKYAIPCL